MQMFRRPLTVQDRCSGAGGMQTIAKALDGARPSFAVGCAASAARSEAGSSDGRGG